MPTQKQPLTVELALLGLLREGTMYPYEMHQRLLQREALGFLWQLKQSHLYALLARLEADGYLVHTLESQGSRPPRKLLRITPEGRAAFAQWLHEPVAHGRDFRLEFLAKLYFASQDGETTVSALIDRQQDACRQRMDALTAQLAALPPDQPFERLVVQFRHGQLAATLTWLDSCMPSLVPIPF